MFDMSNEKGAKSFEKGLRSVHLERFPDLSFIKEDGGLIKYMDYTKDLCAELLSLRKKCNLRVRLPLKQVCIFCTDQLPYSATESEIFCDIIKTEANVKNVEISYSLDSVAKQDITVVFAKCGKRLGSKIKEVILAQKTGEFSVVDGRLHIAGATLEEDEFDTTLKPDDELLSALMIKLDIKSYEVAIINKSSIVVLDTTQYRELELEGLARDFVRAIQTIRKDMQLLVNQKISISYNAANETLSEALKIHESFISQQCLADSVLKDEWLSTNEVQIGDVNVNIEVRVR